MLRNSITKRYPPVPVPKDIVRDEKLDWFEKQKVPIIDETDNEITYIGGIKHESMSKQMQIWKQDLDERLKGKKIIKVG